MKRIFFTILALLLLFVHKVGANDSTGQSYLKWSKLPQLPDKIGFAGAFAGLSNEALLVAGGANFPRGTTPWTGGKKKWYDQVYVLENETAEWKVAGTLPRPLGYGVSITWKDGLICIGGGDANRHYADVFILRYKNGTIYTEFLNPLPQPLANASGVLVGDVIYVAGGTEIPDAKKAEKIFLSLDLSKSPGERSWKVLESWPGPARMLSVAGTQDGAFYLFSGVDLVSANGQNAVRQYLKDAYRYTPAKGWVQLADLPQPVAGAPSPAYTAGQSHLLIFGGDHGKYFMQNEVLKEKHPGFSTAILSYNTIVDSWSKTGTISPGEQPDATNTDNGTFRAPVTTALVVWKGNVILPTGEVGPGVRTPGVMIATPVQPASGLKIMDWLVIGLYFLLTVAIALFVSRNLKKSTSDFFLGEGKIPWWAAGLSIFGTNLSALTFIAIPAKSYSSNWLYFLLNMMIVAIAPVIVYFYLPYFRKLKLTSVYQFLGIRFNQNVKLLGSLTFLLFQVSRLGVVIYLPSLVVSSLMGIDIVLCVIVTSLVTTVYCFFGGIEAVVWTDVMQVVVLLGGALISLVYIVSSLEGGASELFSEAMANRKFQLALLNWNILEPVLWVVVIGGGLSQLVTFSSDQVVVQRYLTTPTEKEAKKSIYTNAVLTIPASIIFFMVGTALWVFFRNHPAQLNPFGRVDDVFPWFIAHQLPAGLSGLVIAGVFAATMSTISSSMNSMATVVTTDFYSLVKPAATDKKRFAFARWTTLTLGVIGCMVAIYMGSLQNTSIWDQYLKIMALLGGCLAGMFVAGIFFRSINSKGILTGFVVSAVSLYFIQAAAIMHFFLYPAVAILICVVVGYVSSRLFTEKKAIVIDKAEVPQIV